MKSDWKRVLINTSAVFLAGVSAAILAREITSDEPNYATIVCGSVGMSFAVTGGYQLIRAAYKQRKYQSNHKNKGR